MFLYSHWLQRLSPLLGDLSRRRQPHLPHALNLPTAAAATVAVARELDERQGALTLPVGSAPSPTAGRPFLGVAGRRLAAHTWQC